ncbi:hypothetical protein TrVE_jg5075 [Triparma verrucosa]|uniref:Choline transporter-like protein n=1 Tax=Triparma verrucosa TaxID=1606542 RepID=A0A9W7EL41_9STRA|nr:hypothetical protein TrVE_jg5075 [Triparma verrucosa]
MASVQPSETIDTLPAKVAWKNRKTTDIGCGLFYLAGILIWFAVGFAFIGSAKPIYTKDEDGIMTGFTDEILEDAKDCCAFLAAQTDTSMMTYNEDGALCPDHGHDDGRVRHLANDEAASDFVGHRFLTHSGNFPHDGGMLDVFAIHPHVALVMVVAVIAIAIGWIIFLRSFAKTVVWTCEAVKVVALGYLGFKSNNNGLFYAMALGYCLYLICFRKKLNFAATIIAHSAKGLKENPRMLPGLLLIKAFYVVQALAFIQFFSKSMEIKTVEPTEIPIIDYFSTQYCTAGDSYTCDWDMAWDATNANHCSNNGGYCEYNTVGTTVECTLIEPSWVGSARWYIMFFWLWCTMWYSTARLSIIAQIIGSWHFHPQDSPGVMTAVKNSIVTGFGTVSFGSLICAIVEQFHRWARLKWYHFVPPLIFMIGPLKIALCILMLCFKTCIKMLTKFSIIIHAFTGLPFVGSAKKCFQIMKRHFVGGFIVETSSVAIMKIFSLVMSLAFAFSTWAWVDDLFGWCTIPGSAGDILWILWTILAVFNIFYPLIGLFCVTLLDRILTSVWDGDPTTDENGNIEVGCDDKTKFWVAPMCGMFVGCIAKLFFDYMGGIILDTIDVMFVCFAIDKDNNVDLSKSDFSAIIVELPGVMKVANSDQDAKASLLVQSAAPVPVAPGQFVNTGAGQPQGMVQQFVAPGAGMQMQPMQMQMPMPMPMVDANGQPMQMPMMPMPMVDANGQPMQMQPMQMQPMQMQPMQMQQQQMVSGQAPTPL